MSSDIIDCAIWPASVTLIFAALYMLIAPISKTETLFTLATTSFFYAIQTVTTTGYGSGFEITDEVKILSCYAMIFGSIAWGVFVARLTK